MLDEHDNKSVTKYELTEGGGKNGKKFTPIVATKTTTSSKERGADYDRVHTLRNALPQILATCAKNLLLLTYGTTLGIATIAIPALDASRRPNETDPNRELKIDLISLSKTEMSWFSSINLICVPLGCFVSGAFTQPLGRKRSMKLLTIPFFLVWVLYYYSRSVVTLYLALVISGLAGGLHEAPVLTYVAEITEPYLRGMLSSTAPTTVIVGTVSQLVLGRFYHWRTVVLINMCFPVLAFIALNFVPESPHWLISKGRYGEAEKSLCWLRGWVHPDEVQHELSILKKFIQTKSNAHKVTFEESIRRYTLRSFLVPHFIVLVIFFVGQFGGMMSLQTNAVLLFQRLGTTEVDEYTATLIFGIVEFIGSATCVGLVHLTGKRKLLITATGISSVCLFTLAAYDYFHQLEAIDRSYLSNFRWIPIVFLNANAFFTHAGIRLLAWVLIGEIYPTSIRATATGVSALWFYVFAFLANKNFGWMFDTFNLYGLLGLYGSVLLFGSIFFYVFVPETEGLELYAIEKHFARKGNIFRTKIRPNVINDEEEVMNGGKVATGAAEI